ncbi:MAG: glycosyltransferase family 4 protein [Verrucomicrobiota bacterium]
MASIDHAYFESKHFVFVFGQLRSFGGAERQALILAESLINQIGAKVSVLTWGKMGTVSERFEALGASCHKVPLNWKGSPLNRILGLKQMAAYCRETIKPDYFLPYIGINCKVAGLIWKFSGASFTWWNQRDEGRDIFGSRLENYLIRRMPAIVSNSYEGQDFLMRTFGLEAQQIRVINNGIILPELSDGAKWRKDLSLGPNDSLLLMTANLTKYKDHSTLIKAFAKIKKARPDKRQVLVCAGRHADTTTDLKVLLYDLGLSSADVLLPGRVDNVSELISAADIVVHSSKFEGCPNAALEGMANRKCVLGTDISGMRQALGEPSAKECLAPADDADALAQRCLHFLDHPQEREAHGKRNRERVTSEYSIAKLTNETLQTIRENESAPRN